MTTQSATDEATAAFRDAQQWVLDRYQVQAQPRFVEVRSISARAQVLVTGEGRAVEHMPDADLHVMPGGHAPWLHRAGQVAALAHEFLDTR